MQFPNDINKFSQREDTQAAVNEDSTSVEESQTVAQKKQNAKQLAKQVKQTKAFIAKELDLKQVAQAVTALQKYSKAKK